MARVSLALALLLALLGTGTAPHWPALSRIAVSALTLPELNCSHGAGSLFFAPLFWFHMLRARPALGVCFLS